VDSVFGTFHSDKQPENLCMLAKSTVLCQNMLLCCMYHKIMLAYRGLRWVCKFRVPRSTNYKQ